MRQIRITKPTRTRRRHHDDLPLDPRDPDILRAKQAARRAAEAPPESDQIR